VACDPGGFRAVGAWCLGQTPGVAHGRVQRGTEHAGRCLAVMAKAAVTAAAVALGLVHPAYGETRIERGATREDNAPAITIVEPLGATLERTHLAIASAGTATLSLALSSRETSPRVAITIIDVPHGAQVTAMRVAMFGVRTEAVALNADTAKDRFHEIVTRKDDPALLELVTSTDAHDRMTLKVFPVAKTSRVRIEIAIALPVIDALVVNAPGIVSLALDDKPVRGRRAVLPTQRDWMSVDPAPRPAVSSSVSLFAAGPVREPTRLPTVTVATHGWTCGVGTERVVDSRMIRKQVKLAIPRLRHCYERQLQREWTLEGSADLHFLIAHDGRPRDISIDGTLTNENVRMCLAEDISTWKFSPIDVLTQVNYPLTFRAAP